VLHRQKAESDVFLVVNQNHQGAPRQFKFRTTAQGTPECWDAMRNAIHVIPFQRTGNGAAEFTLTLEPLEGVLLVFQPKPIAAPRQGLKREPSGTPAPQQTIAVTRVPYTGAITRGAPEERKAAASQDLRGRKWVWYPEGNPAAGAPAGTRYFRRTITIPEGEKIKRAGFTLTCDNDFVLYINGKEAGRSEGDSENWRQPKQIDVAKHLQPGVNLLAIAATNAASGVAINPAGLIGRYTIALEKAPGKEADPKDTVSGAIDRSWKTSQKEERGWNAAGFDDSVWAPAKELVSFGGAPWGTLDEGGNLTTSPVAVSDLFVGRFTLPAALDLAKSLVYVELEGVPDDSAAIRINGVYAGGMIGKPLRLNVTNHVKLGENTVEIAPLAPKAVRVIIGKPCP
jgi:hypothetical protein